MKIKNLLKSLSIASITAALVFSLVILPTIGCSSTTFADLTKTLGAAAVNIATLEGNTALSTQLTADTNAAVTAITNWKSGTPADDVIQALGIVEADLNLIPGTSQYAPLIDIAIATVQTILSMLPASTTASAALSTHTHFRAVHLGHPAPANAKQFREQWNSVVAANPNLAAARIK
jgi:hypothetical protein